MVRGTLVARAPSAEKDFDPGWRTGILFEMSDAALPTIIIAVRGGRLRAQPFVFIHAYR